MIFIGLGSNLPSRWGDCEQTLRIAIKKLNAGLSNSVEKESRLIITPPFGPVHQPDFFNAVVSLQTSLTPMELLLFLRTLEEGSGRVRQEKWGPRSLDLDLLEYHGLIWSTPTLTLPHPGIAERRFVLEPLGEIAPEWRHPVIGKTSLELLKELEVR